MKSGKRYVIGIGTYMGADDGIGLRIVEALGDRGLVQGFEAVEIGHSSLSFHSYLDPGTERILMVDCAKMGLAPGQWRIFAPEDVVSDKKLAGFSTHEGDMLQMIELARSLGTPIPPIRILGIEPMTLQESMELSPVLAGRFEEYVSLVVKTIHEHWDD